MTKFKYDDTFLARWLNDDLTDQELKDFENNEDYKTLSKIALKSAEFEIPAFDKSDTKDRVKKAAYYSKSKVRPLYYKIAIAASLILIFTLGGINYIQNKTTTLTTNYGESKVFTLPDGSYAELNGNSSLVFKNKKWRNNKRFLSLKGECYFKVKRGSKFTVQSDQGIINVLGTQFNVKALGNFYMVECYEGKVLIENAKNKITLTRGNSVQYKNGKLHKATFTNTIPNWKNDVYIYDETPLNVVFNDLQNMYEINELITTKVNLNQKFTGKLVVNDLKKALNIVCKPMNLEYKLLKNTIIISQL
ncbi:FecR family protein [Aquimarina algicola]|uniref:FecR family protein n=1 Tax=Aquimarina algicola TaxID=2589995 RepID=A0A504JDU5_9FLAO|nr:FecR family protein [Aquimarina algicola]TPN85773.1 FecR family protein [Aquimarina algicola]